MQQSKRKREFVSGEALDSIEGIDPMQGVTSISGVRVYDVGQGDAISILDQRGRAFIHIDYGGRFNSPFRNSSISPDHRMPVDPSALLMLTHWDDDHWCSAMKGVQAREAMWLVPRQLTSPRAAYFSAELPKIYCIPEDRVGIAHEFAAANGDVVIWEKIAPSAHPGEDWENCNETGVAYSVVKRSLGEVILLPGDAPFHRVGHYAQLAASRLKLRGLVAYHHGSHAHWTQSTNSFLNNWRRKKPALPTVVFSYGRGNSYGHPDRRQYRSAMGRTEIISTPMVRDAGCAFFDLLF